MLAKPTTSLDELVEGVADDLFDTVMTGISINAERIKIVDFSKALIPSSYRVVIRKPKSFQSDHLFFLKPFAWSLWLLILLTIPFASVLLWFVERKDSTKLVNINDRFSLGTSISYVISALLGRSHSYVLQTTPGRWSYIWFIFSTNNINNSIYSWIIIIFNNTKIRSY